MYGTSRRVLVAGSVAAVALTGCYVIPIASSDGTPVYAVAPVPAVVAPAPVYVPPSAQARSNAVPGAAAPSVLQARLYPANDAATQTGLLSGTVTNMMTGKGRFQLNYAGEMLTGEATRVSGDDRKGIASAYGASGAFMSCEYQMNTPLQGAGNCLFSNGAKYKVHIGN